MPENNASAKTDVRKNTSGIRNVRQVTAANDNYQYPASAENQWYSHREDNEESAKNTASQQRRNITNVKRVVSPANGDRSSRTDTKSDKIVPVQQTAVKLINGWRLLSTALAATTKIYIIQIFFGILALVGYGLAAGVDAAEVINITTFGTASALGAGLYLLGASGAALCGFFTYIGASGWFRVNGRDPLSGPSIFIAVVCIVALLCPIASLFPIVWLWCLYPAFWGGDA